MDVSSDEGKTLYKVQYPDCDQEEVDSGQLWDQVIYHPRLEDALYLPDGLPEVGTIIVFAENQEPRIGTVVAINEKERTPIGVRLWRPSSKAASWVVARYRLDEDKVEKRQWITPTQVQHRGLKFTREGFLDRHSRKLMARAIRGTRVSRTERKKGVKRDKTKTCKKTSGTKRPHTSRRSSTAAKHRYNLRRRR